MIAVLLVCFAPAPVPKPPAKPLSPVGEWNLRWRGIDAPVKFDADGGFACFWQSKPWKGTWKLEDGLLHVEEWLANTDGTSTFKWTVRLDPGKMEGEIDSSLWLPGLNDNRFKLDKP